MPSGTFVASFSEADRVRPKGARRVPAGPPFLNHAYSNGVFASKIFFAQSTLGHGKYAILEMEDYDRPAAEDKLFSELEAGRVSGEQEGWISSEDVRNYFARKNSNTD